MWSIEWVEARHHRDRVTGTMHRIYPQFFDRCWTFDFVTKGDFVGGSYRCRRGSGDDGTLAMRRKRNVMCRGKFQAGDADWEAVDDRDQGFTARVEWLSVNRDLAADIREHLAGFYTAQPVNVDRAIRDRLNGCLRGHTPTTNFLEKFGGGAAGTDLAGPLAVARLKRQFESQALARWHPGAFERSPEDESHDANNTPTTGPGSATTTDQSSGPTTGGTSPTAS